MTRHQREFACAHPSGLPLACNPRMERASLGFSPDASNPAVTGDARQGRDGSSNTDPKSAVVYMTDPPIQRTRSYRATSCRNEEVESLGALVQVHDPGLNDGFIAGEQDTPGAPWRIRMTDELRALFVDDAPEGWLAMLEATLAYGVTRQTLLQRVKRGELQAVHVRTGRRKGLRIEPPTPQETLF
jgi:hypothetical protein